MENDKPQAAKVAKPVKDDALIARVSKSFKAEVQTYLDGQDLSEAWLIRQAVKEYMVNHPIKKEEQQ